MPANLHSGFWIMSPMDSVICENSIRNRQKCRFTSTLRCHRWFMLPTRGHTSETFAPYPMRPSTQLTKNMSRSMIPHSGIYASQIPEICCMDSKTPWTRKKWVFLISPRIKNIQEISNIGNLFKSLKFED